MTVSYPVKHTPRAPGPIELLVVGGPMNGMRMRARLREHDASAELVIDAGAVFFPRGVDDYDVDLAPNGRSGTLRLRGAA